MIKSTIGPYCVVRKLGEGGMGAVYEAVHETIERRVALKVLHAQYATNRDLAQRLFNEARAVNRVDHPGLVQVSDFGHLPDNTAYLVMELLTGETLGARLRQLGAPMPVAEVLYLGRQVADALAAAHAKNIVHRDLKPDNVMIIPDPYMQRRERTKLLDFGIAKLDTSKDSPRLKTNTHVLLGTPAYMSPEQCRGAGLVDAKSDVYSFGIMLYTMLTGKPPFAGAGLVEIIGKHLHDAPPPLASRAPWVPAPVAALVHSLLQKKKEQRPAMSEVASELESLLDQQPAPPTQSQSAAQLMEAVAKTCLADPGKQTQHLSTASSLVWQSQGSRKSWRHVLLTSAVLGAMAMAVSFGLSTKMDSLAAPPKSALGGSMVAIARGEAMAARNTHGPPHPVNHEPPAALEPKPGHRAVPQSPRTGRVKASRVKRKKLRVDIPQTPAPAKHSSRPAL